MASEVALVFFVSTGMAATLAVGFSLPKLTENGGGQTRNASFQKNVEAEASYCSKNPGSVNCACFAQKSGYVRSFDQPRIRNAEYSDRTTLARAQASKSC